MGVWGVESGSNRWKSLLFTCSLPRAQLNWKATMDRNYDLLQKLQNAFKLGDRARNIKTLCETGEPVEDFFMRNKTDDDDKPIPLRKDLGC